MPDWKLDHFFGLGLGRVRIKLGRYQYEFGEDIEGRVLYAFKREVATKGLYVGLKAEQRVISHRAGGRSVSKLEVYRFEYPVLEADDYLEGAETFSLRIPGEVANVSAERPAGRLGEIAQIIAFLSPTTRMPLKWTVFARFDLPWKIGPKEKVDIDVLQSRQGPNGGN